jgi:hypothetical protein
MLAISKPQGERAYIMKIQVVAQVYGFVGLSRCAADSKPV